MNPVSLEARFPRYAALCSLALAGCLLAGAMSPARAAQPADVSDDVPTTRVSYGDLNLATEQGTQRLYERIVAAARQVCPEADPRDLSRFVRSRACRAQAIERAVNEVGSPRLAAVYAAHVKQG